MRVCLINPPPHSVQEPMYDTPIFVRPALACLGATLREAGIACLLIDAKFERLPAREVLARVQAYRPDLVGLTAFTNEIKPAARIAASVKEWSHETTTLIGGVHVSAIPERTLNEFPAFDLACIGQGDYTIVELAQALADETPLSRVPGLMWRGEQGLLKSVPRQPPALDGLPMPAWDMLPGGSRYHLMTQRGCPFTCNFCMNPNGRTVRRRTPEQIVQEIEGILARFGPRDPINIWFDDEIFTVNMRRTAEVCDTLLAAGLQKRIGWFAQTHVNVVDKPLLAKMKQAGCKRVGLGIESADETVLKSMGKGSTLERAWRATRAAREVGMPLEAYFIIGHPGETVESARRTIDFAAGINPEIPIFGIMVPYPGTSVARRAERGEGGYRIISSEWNDYNKQIGGAVEFEHLSRFHLEWLQTSGYVYVFLKNRRIEDLAKFVWQYRRQGLTILKKWGTQAIRALRGAQPARKRAPSGATPPRFEEATLVQPPEPSPLARAPLAESLQVQP